MLTWKRIGDDRYRISMCYFWPRYDVEFIKAPPKDWRPIGNLKKDQEKSEDGGIIDHVDCEGPDGEVAWWPVRILKIYANV